MVGCAWRLDWNPSGRLSLALDPDQAGLDDRAGIAPWIVNDITGVRILDVRGIHHQPIRITHHRGPCDAIIGAAEDVHVVKRGNQLMTLGDKEPEIGLGGGFSTFSGAGR